MSSGVSSPREEIVSLELDLGSYELGANECGELIRVLRARGRRPGGGTADASADRLEGLLDRRAGTAIGAVTEGELDAIADAAWDWLQRVGPAACPERVVVVLDVLRARHAHQ